MLPYFKVPLEGLTVFKKFTKIHDLGKKLGRCQWNCWLPIGKQKYNGKG
jgi:hypothetical protein